MVAVRRGLYVRWSRDPARDLAGMSSTDDLSGVDLPGLSASPLDIEDWWGEKPPHVWVARRPYDYSHLPRVKDSRTRPGGPPALGLLMEPAGARGALVTGGLLIAATIAAGFTLHTRRTPSPSPCRRRTATSQTRQPWTRPPDQRPGDGRSHRPGRPDTAA